MKPLLPILLCLQLSSCGVKINPDGSKEVTVDAVALGAAITAYGQSKIPPKVREEKSFSAESLMDPVYADYLDESNLPTWLQTPPEWVNYNPLYEPSGVFPVRPPSMGYFGSHSEYY